MKNKPQISVTDLIHDISVTGISIMGNRIELTRWKICVKVNTGVFVWYKTVEDFCTDLIFAKLTVHFLEKRFAFTANHGWKAD